MHSHRQRRASTVPVVWCCYATRDSLQFASASASLSVKEFSMATCDVMWAGRTQLGNAQSNSKLARMLSFGTATDLQSSKCSRWCSETRETDCGWFEPRTSTGIAVATMGANSQRELEGSGTVLWLLGSGADTMAGKIRPSQECRYEQRPPGMVPRRKAERLRYFFMIFFNQFLMEFFTFSFASRWSWWLLVSSVLDHLI